MAIDFQNLPNKDQLQKAGAAIGIGLVMLAALYYLVIAPMLRERTQLQDSIATAQAELAKNRTLVTQTEKVEKNYEQTRQELFTLMHREMAPAENPVSWISSIMQEIAVRHGVTISSLSGSGILRTRSTSRMAPPPLFERFQAKITLDCTYHQFGRFLADLEKRISFGKIESLNMQPASGADTQRRLSIDLTYSVLRFTEEMFPSEQRPTGDEPGVSLSLPEIELMHNKVAADVQ